MASIRDNIQLALVARLQEIAGWNVQLRGAVNTGNHAVKAIVVFLGEDKVLAGNDQYFATMTVGVEITGRVEDASPTTDGNNPYRYIDRLVVLAEQTIHSPDSWGLDPDFTDVRIDGHDVADPPSADDFTEVSALLRLTFTYRHHYQDPEA